MLVDTKVYFSSASFVLNNSISYFTMFCLQGKSQKDLHEENLIMYREGERKVKDLPKFLTENCSLCYLFKFLIFMKRETLFNFWHILRQIF